jgi:hypothetical protein
MLDWFKDYDKSHGSAYDRGSADAYYGRPHEPHYYTQTSFNTCVWAMHRVGLQYMTTKQLEAYDAGFYNEKDRKDYGVEAHD